MSEPPRADAEPPPDVSSEPPPDVSSEPPDPAAEPTVAPGSPPDAPGSPPDAPGSPPEPLPGPRRQPSPGPSFARAEPLRLRGAREEPGPRVRLGMLRPSVMEDGWWLTTLWAEDDEGVIEALAVAPSAGPPPVTPLQVIGPSLSGALMGLLDQEEGRQLIRLRMAPTDDESRPWRRPLLMLVALRWDPVRASTLTTSQLAGELMRAFRNAIEAAGAPGRIF